MKLKIIILAIAFVLLSFASAFSDETTNKGTWEGDIGATALVDSVSGSKAKFSEYQDETKGGGIYSDVRLGYDSDTYWMKFSATDIGYKTQNYTLDGGMYGKFSYDLFYNQIIHNITSGALTPYSGVGSNTLTAATVKSGSTYLLSNTNPATWNVFDYSISRNQYGGSFNLSLPKPFYVNFGISREDRTGLVPWSSGDGNELPAPVNYETTNYVGEIGYQAKPVFAALNYTYTDFTNQNQLLTSSGTGTVGGATTDLKTLPPDNSVYRIGFKGSVMLPLNSRFNVSLANAHERSTFDLSPLVNYYNAISSSNQIRLSSNQFNGRETIQNYAFSLTSNPVPFLDGKLFYKYYSTTNKSSDITQTITGSGGGTIVVPLFDYKKNTYGVDLGFKLPVNFHLDAKYAYIDTDRENRPDIPSTKDNVYSAELRWNGLDLLTPKISYERLERLAQYGPPYSLDQAISPTHVNFPQVTMVDGAKERRDTYKAAVDVNPLDNLNFGVAYKYKKSTYPDTILVVTDSNTNEFEAYGDYLIGGLVRLNAYFDLQNITAHLTDYNGTSISPAGKPPTVNLATTNATNYLWNMTQKDNTYDWGAGVDIYLVPKKLTLRLQYDYVNSDGNEDFSFAFPGVITGVNANSASGPIGDPNLDNDVDSYHKSAFMVKTTYVISKAFSMALGASFEQYKYNDYGLENPNYQYYSSVTGSFLTGAYANPSYNASIVFITAAYKF